MRSATRRSPNSTARPFCPSKKGAQRQRHFEAAPPRAALGSCCAPNAAHPGLGLDGRVVTRGASIFILTLLAADVAAKVICTLSFPLIFKSSDDTVEGLLASPQ